MRIYLYDYAGTTNKLMIQPISCVISHQALGDLYTDITCEASAYYKGEIALGDMLRLPYPCAEDENGNLFRITDISTEGDTLTLKAWHQTYDFEQAVCTRWATTSETLQAFVNEVKEVIRITKKVEDEEDLTDDETAIFAVKSIQNCHGLTVAFWCHDTDDSRYTTKHECNPQCMGGSAMLEHISATYAPNLIRDGSTLVFTYGTESEYFRNKYSLGDYAPIYKANTNVSGYSTANSIDGFVTSIAATCDFNLSYTTDDKEEQFCAFVVNSAYTDKTAEAWRYMTVVKYTTELKIADYDTYQAYRTAVIADVKAQAQEEVDSYVWEGQNVTVESVGTSTTIFGGETSICADKRTRTDYEIAIESFEFDAVAKRYGNIQLGRVTASLSDLATGVSAGSGSSGTASGGGLTFAEILAALKTQFVYVDGVHSYSGAVIEGTASTENLKVSNTAQIETLLASSPAQLQGGVMVGNVTPMNQSLQLWNSTNGTTYSYDFSKGATGGYVTLPWGMMLIWGAVTVTSDSSCICSVEMPVKCNKILSFTANTTSVVNGGCVEVTKLDQYSTAMPNRYVTCKVIKNVSGGTPYDAGTQHMIYFQAIAY